MQAPIEALIRDQSGGSQANRLAWEHASCIWETLGLPMETQIRALRASPDPRAHSRLAKLLGEAPCGIHEAWQRLQEQVDESSYSLEEFLTALSHLMHWADEQGQHLRLESALGYLHCCNLVDPQGDLPETILHMLRQHGFSGRQG